jgi:dephospho-CoA kinase
MLVIGLTGGIGSGKSTVANLFAKKGIAIIDTDELARELTQPGHETLNKIAMHFGKNILLPDGSLNRKLLRSIIFSDTNQRLWLEQLLHPLIRTEMQLQIEAATSPYCIAIIPLLFETKPNPIIDRILVIDTTEEEQIQRTQQRDQISLEAVQAILHSQVSREHRLVNAADIIHNNGSITDLNQQVDNLHSFYLSIS